MNINLGDRIIYKGDMANDPGEGAVVKVHVKERSGQVYAMSSSRPGLYPIDDSKVFDIALDDGRIFRQVYVSNIGGDFSNKSCRFMLAGGAPLDAESIAGLEDAVAIRVASIKAKAGEVKAIMFAAMAACEIEGKKLGLIPEKEFQAAGKRGSAAAYNLRAELKAAGIKASVKQDGYSALRVSVPAADVVAANEICGKYEAGSFDGMVDCYNYDPSAWGNVFGDVQYVFCSVDR